MNGSDNSDGDAPAYEVIPTERYEAERDATSFYLLRRNPLFAARWLETLVEFLQSLAVFPGPYAHVVDQAASRRYGRETHRALFYGPPNKRTGAAYRIYDTVEESDVGGQPGIIRVLRILHGAQQTLDAAAGEELDETTNDE